MPSSREFRPPPSLAQKEQQVNALCGAIDAICDAWDWAIEAEQSRGFPAQNPPVSSANSNPQNGDQTGRYTISDPTGNAALRPDRSTRWLSEARRCLKTLLWLSSANTPGRWNGHFYPPQLRTALKRAAEDGVEFWPMNFDKLLSRIHGLANTARNEWPTTPKVGQVVDGVKVGQRNDSTEVCAECGKVALGNAADPIVRIDGKPYHRQPCYNTVYVRRQRARVKQSGDVKQGN